MNKKECYPETSEEWPRASRVSSFFFARAFQGVGPGEKGVGSRGLRGPRGGPTGS